MSDVTEKADPPRESSSAPLKADPSGKAASVDTQKPPLSREGETKSRAASTNTVPHQVVYDPDEYDKTERRYGTVVAQARFFTPQLDELPDDEIDFNVRFDDKFSDSEEEHLAYMSVLTPARPGTPPPPVQQPVSRNGHKLDQEVFQGPPAEGPKRTNPAADNKLAISNLHQAVWFKKTPKEQAKSIRWINKEKEPEIAQLAFELKHNIRCSL